MNSTLFRVSHECPYYLFHHSPFITQFHLHHFIICYLNPTSNWSFNKHFKLNPVIVLCVSFELRMEINLMENLSFSDRLLDWCKIIDSAKLVVEPLVINNSHISHLINPSDLQIFLFGGGAQNKCKFTKSTVHCTIFYLFSFALCTYRHMHT